MHGTVLYARDQEKIVAPCKVGHALKLLAGPDPATGIVRRTEDRHLLGPGHLRVPGVEIHLVDAVADGKLVARDLNESQILSLIEGRKVKVKSRLEVYIGETTKLESLLKFIRRIDPDAQQLDFKRRGENEALRQ